MWGLTFFVSFTILLSITHLFIGNAVSTFLVNFRESYVPSTAVQVLFQTFEWFEILLPSILGLFLIYLVKVIDAHILDDDEDSESGGEQTTVQKVQRLTRRKTEYSDAAPMGSLEDSKSNKMHTIFSQVDNEVEGVSYSSSNNLISDNQTLGGGSATIAGNALRKKMIIKSEGGKSDQNMRKFHIQ